ncbi:MAG: hypothetical protein JW384_02286 [Nitrosomonadaceae bacterium]|nr:hypothetical protein [Nitrosomonadaceae bacterium]
MLPVKLDQSGNIDICETVSIGTAKILAVEVWGNALDPPSSHRVVAGIYQRYAPWFRAVLVDLHPVVRHVEGHIRHMEKVVSEIFLDYISLIAQAHDEIVDAVGRINFHDVPQDRLATYLDHWLWLNNSFFSQPCSKPTS